MSSTRNQSPASKTFFIFRSALHSVVWFPNGWLTLLRVDHLVQLRSWFFPKRLVQIFDFLWLPLTSLSEPRLSFRNPGVYSPYLELTFKLFKYVFNIDNFIHTWAYISTTNYFLIYWYHQNIKQVVVPKLAEFQWNRPYWFNWCDFYGWEFVSIFVLTITNSYDFTLYYFLFIYIEYIP
jgi:hypothetical protein